MEAYKVIQNANSKKKLGPESMIREFWVSKVGNKRIIKFKVVVRYYDDYKVIELPNKNENGKDLTLLDDHDIVGEFNEVRIPQSLKYINLGKIKGLERIVIDRQNENIYIKENMVLCKPKKHCKILLLVMNNMRNNVIIPNDVRRINEKAFHLVKYLHHIYIPKTVCELGNNIFKGIMSVKYVFLQNGIAREVQDRVDELVLNGKFGRYVFVENFKGVEFYLENEVHDTTEEEN